jgi:hypothetical protein
MTTFTNDKIQWTKIKHNVNGNPRYVCHFLHLSIPAENTPEFWAIHGLKTISVKYALTCKRANKIGGKKYHTKAYGGGIVFQSYNLQDTERSIFELLEKESKGE